jgi:hypothetical protein
MGGQPWLELELHGRPWGCSSERGERGNERARGGMAGGHDRGCRGGRGVLGALGVGGARPAHVLSSM